MSCGQWSLSLTLPLLVWGLYGLPLGRGGAGWGGVGGFWVVGVVVVSRRAVLTLVVCLAVVVVRRLAGVVVMGLVEVVGAGGVGFVVLAVVVGAGVSWGPRGWGVRRRGGAWCPWLCAEVARVAPLGRRVLAWRCGGGGWAWRCGLPPSCSEVVVTCCCCRPWRAGGACLRGVVVGSSLASPRLPLAVGGGAARRPGGRRRRPFHQ